MDDLKELLELKKDIESIKEKALDPNLDPEAKLQKLRDLQETLARLKVLKETMDLASVQPKDNNIGKFIIILIQQYFSYDPEQDRRLFELVSGSKGIDPVILLFFKDNKAHNVHDKDVHYQNSITKPHIH